MTPIILIESEEHNSGYIRTAHLFPSVDSAKDHIKKVTECTEEELQEARENTLSADCECYAFDDYIYHIYTSPVIHS